MQENQAAYRLLHSQLKSNTENTFVLFVTRWRILHSPINPSQKNCEKIFVIIL